MNIRVILFDFGYFNFDLPKKDISSFGDTPRTKIRVSKIDRTGFIQLFCTYRVQLTPLHKNKTL